MAIMLTEDTKKFRTDTETEAIEKIDAIRQDQLKGGYTVTKSSYVMKTRKSKGEIVDSWFNVAVTMSYDI